MQSTLPWRPASDFQPKQYDDFLVSYVQSSDGCPPSMLLAIGRIEIGRDGNSVIHPILTPVDGITIPWTDVRWAIPYQETVPPLVES